MSKTIDVPCPPRSQGFPLLLLCVLSAVPGLAGGSDVQPAAEGASAASAAADAGAAKPASVQAAEPSETPRQRAEGLAKRYGYTLVERDGDYLFCKEQAVTASRVRKQRRCVSEDQMQLEATSAVEVLDKVNKGFTPQTP